jgi:prepilin-type N-terminal cleavage/methylation domain-containing protein
MMFHKLGLINKNQRGFTLMEIVLVFAISGIIAGSITMTLFQVVNGSGRTNNHMTAVRQVQNAGYWVSHDAQLAQSIEIDDNPLGGGFPLVLSWTGWDDVEHEVTYSLEEMVGGPKQLKQSYSIGSELTETIVAQFINPDPEKTKCGFTDGMLVFTVTATVGYGSQEQSETRVYEIVPRPGL